MFAFAPSPAVRVRRLAVCVVLACLAAPVAAEARARASRPTFIVQPGPAVVALTADVAAVPAQPRAVFLCAGVYWTRYDGLWFRAAHRRGAWGLVRPNDVPLALYALTAAQVQVATDLSRPAKARRHAKVARTAVKARQVHKAPAHTSAADELAAWDEDRAAWQRHVKSRR